jgi:hypothetical protein
VIPDHARRLEPVLIPDPVRVGAFDIHLRPAL